MFTLLFKRALRGFALAVLFAVSQSAVATYITYPVPPPGKVVLVTTVIEDDNGDWIATVDPIWTHSFDIDFQYDPSVLQPVNQFGAVDLYYANVNFLGGYFSNGAFNSSINFIAPNTSRILNISSLFTGTNAEPNLFSVKFRPVNPNIAFGSFSIGAFARTTSYVTTLQDLGEGPVQVTYWGSNIITKTVFVPEPNAIAIFVFGFTSLLVFRVGRQRTQKTNSPLVSI